MMERKKRVAAVIAAAGVSGRMEGINKLFAPIAGRPVLYHAIHAFEETPEVGEIVLVCNRGDREKAQELCADAGFQKVSGILPGGETRTLSVFAGVKEAWKRAELIAVHDGARPCVTPEEIRRAVEAAARTGAAALGVPVTDTIKRVVRGKIAEDMDRAALWAMQTPQVFHAEALYHALKGAVEKGIGFTDDCAAVSAAGHAVSVVMGRYDNVKITTQADLTAAAAILGERGKPACASGTDTTPIG